MPTNLDPAEIAKFDELAHHWWDPHGSLKTLHALQPLRLQWVEGSVELKGRRALDVGCGGGLLSEGLARRGAQITGIDLSTKALEVARLHLLESGLTVQYRAIAVEELAVEQPEGFELLTCMELLEHVPDPLSVLTACAKLVTRGGNLFFSTLSRTPRAYAQAIVGAEYLLNWLPKGTHQYQRFIKPSELCRMARSVDLELVALSGVGYQAFARRFALRADPGVNYLAHFRRRT